MMAAPKLKTLQDFIEASRVSEGPSLELIDGEIVRKAMPGGKHGKLASRVVSRVETVFDRKSRSDGTGGWWILSDVSVHYRKMERVLEPDIAGWRRDRISTCPSEFPVPDRPDWVCEICHTTRKKDTTIVPETMAAEGVPFYWLLDVEHENLQVFELVEPSRKYALVRSLFRNDGNVRIPPFDAVTFNINVLLGDDED
ncbi:MAG: Uma2 family endonuclease [Silvanigrellales bacterium]|nr:Uma2 family endonuclease [Silvanigrellales bacterium]